ncbi:MAG TPA: PGPGW domain-containing protein [Candidatus Saccharimonadales bacterium]
MEHLKHRWKRVPSTIRRPVVFIVGSIFIIAAALTGWLPGPGGIPLFLVGIAILATEFEQAQRFRDMILRGVRGFGQWYREHRIIGTVFLIFCAAVAISIGILAYKMLQ